MDLTITCKDNKAAAMGKPWARIEVDYLTHPKFLALNANAICLWHEGKNYCDTHHTDGLIPRDALKTFRFRGVKSVQILLTTCSMPKPDGTPYAPLWEEHSGGYKMHDYLDHNDCREKVLARLAEVDKQKTAAAEVSRARMARWRAAKKTKPNVTPDVTADVTASLRSISVPVPETKEERTREGALTAPRPLAPIHDRSHRNHAFCGRVCLHASLFSEFVRRRNHPDADAEIRAWCLTVDTEWGDGGPRAAQEPGDPFDFWKACYSERWPTTAAAKARLPVWAKKAIAAKEAKA